MQQHIFAPLGLRDTTFVTNAEHDARHAHMHILRDGKFSEIPPIIPFGDKVEFHSGGAGTHSTATDYTTVLLALLDGSERILKKESVDLLFTDQSTPMGLSFDKPRETTTPDIVSRPNFMSEVPRVWTYGGFKTEAQMPTGRSLGSVSAAGMPNCFWWVDIEKGLAGVFFTQILPPSDPDVATCFSACESLLYSGLDL
eukprot:Phypoly_transcript_15417.p1 GENE.Phypoly_transcript_15417~~Phypoly_transcript_15417.p1  ORF type:complete len:198 (+),score=29.97 Phypoly_transcript_15417:321-914(+)